MDRTSSSTQGVTPFSYETLPNEIHGLILNEIPDRNGPAGRPTLRSVSCVNQLLNRLARRFLLERYVSKAEKEMNRLLQLKGWWRSEHGDRTPTTALLDAFGRTGKSMDGLTVQELETYVAQSEAPLSTHDNKAILINEMIAAQMLMESDCNAISNLAAHYRQMPVSLEKPVPSE